MDAQYIHGQVRIFELKLEFAFTAIYGLHTIQDTRSLWGKLQILVNSQQGPWIAMDNFNVVLNQEDRLHGTQIQDYETMDFREFMVDNGLVELQTIGRDYTWTNNHTFSRIDRAIDDILIEEEKVLKKQLEKWGVIEESIYRQKSRVKWLKEGDSNSVYLFTNMKSRYSQNYIRSLTNTQGDIIHSEAEIKDEVIEFYKKLFGTATSTLPAINPIIMKQGDEVTEVVLDFFKTDTMFRVVNCTSVTLIRKILTKRLQTVINDLVDDCQSAFVPGRMITDNIILIHELVKCYGRKGISPRCTIKLDMQKAYDFLEWVFLEQILIGMAFSDMFVKWVISCVNTVSYSILLNGKPTPPFDARRGLRQGDPLSSFLFELAMECLTRNLKTLRKIPDFNYHPICDKMQIMQLGFADDLLLFCRGLTVNKHKSSIFFGGVSDDEKKEIMKVLGIPKDELPVRYLGVPLRLLYANTYGIYARKKRLWIKWVHNYYVKRNHLWEIKPRNASWMVSKVFKAMKTVEAVGYTYEDLMDVTQFSIKKFYHRLRGDFHKISWRRLVCNNPGYNKWTFILQLLQVLCRIMDQTAQLARHQQITYEMESRS
ncbi:uncharacterized protein LOC142172764 [Nicotiana tabacum]|uniref:Uncharacterized protein LOC142172764 n=1 Tax=Nicotiana tabacum TaxID=4097 RepID=A0AC58T5Q1_TOBAC